MTAAPPSSLILIAVAPTSADVELAAAAVSDAAASQSASTQALLYASDKFSVPAPVRSRAMNGLAPGALVRLHNAGLDGERAERPAYFRAGFIALALADALAQAAAGTVAAWAPDPTTLLGGRLDAPSPSDALWLATAGGRRPWHVLRVDDPARVNAALARTVDAYLDGTAWRLRDRGVDRVLAAALATVA
ncbi:hypothetical protein [Brevundimonas sp.]|uniref:hypothetical protein n=1 Tax=Brevundimonas sp. TaxID=1871086 RepID=UPI003D6CC30E